MGAGRRRVKNLPLSPEEMFYWMNNSRRTPSAFKNVEREENNLGCDNDSGESGSP